MPHLAVKERFDVSSVDSSLTFYAASPTQSAYGKTTDLSGFFELAWNADGSLAAEPAANMHVEFKVESLRTGNELQDREMWKLIDSKRFPKIAGQITLAGLARRYEGEFRLDRDAQHVALDGEVKIDVRDFGLKPIKLLVLGVAPLVRVRLHLVATKAV